jgi:uncharacterized membrane protein
MNRRVAACLILTAFLLAPAAAAETAEFVARGNEPGWIVRKTVDGITFSSMYGPEVTVSPLPQMQEADGAAIYEATVNGESFKRPSRRRCVDTMSGSPSPRQRRDQGRDSGCGGEPAARPWRGIEQIDGNRSPRAERHDGFGTEGKAPAAPPGKGFSVIR